MNKALLQDLITQANELKELPDGWNSYDAPPPSDSTVKNVKLVLQVLCDFSFPIHLVPDVNGGIGIILSNSNVYADFSCNNDGTILGITSNRADVIDVWEVDSNKILLSIEKINKFIGENRES